MCSFQLVCTEAGEEYGLLSSLVCICTEWHRLCTTPSLVWSGGSFSTLLWSTSSTQWMGGQSHCLCLCQSSLLCSELEDRSSWSAAGLTITLNLFTHPHFPSPFFPIPSKIHFVALTVCPLVWTAVRFLSLNESNKLLYFPIAACAKFTPGCYQISDLIILGICFSNIYFSFLSWDTFVVLRMLDVLPAHFLLPSAPFSLLIWKGPRHFSKSYI